MAGFDASRSMRVVVYEKEGGHPAMPDDELVLALVDEVIGD
jgi:hypothetical protein